MRIGRKFIFWGRILALVPPYTLNTSRFTHVMIAAGTLRFVSGGRELSIDQEPRDEVADDLVAESPPDERDAPQPSNEEAVLQALLADEGLVIAPVTCTIVLRDLDGTIPFVHVGLGLTVNVVRAELHKEGQNLYVPVIGVDNEAANEADFRLHVYDVVRQRSMTVHEDLQHKSLVTALGTSSPWTLLVAHAATRDAKMDLSKRKVRKTSALARDRNSHQSQWDTSMYKASRAAHNDLTQMYKANRTRLCVQRKLLDLIEPQLLLHAMRGFNGLYALAQTTLQAPSDPQGVCYRLEQLLTCISLDGRQAARASVCELVPLAAVVTRGRRAALRPLQRLFFGALADVLEYEAHDSVIGTWRGTFWNANAFLPPGENVAFRPPGANVTGEMLSIARLARDFVNVSEDRSSVVSIAYWLHAAVHHRQITFARADSLFDLKDVIKDAQNSAEWRKDEFALDLLHCRDDLIEAAVKFLETKKVWVIPPLATTQRYSISAIARGAGDSLALRMPPMLLRITARAYDVGKKLTQRLARMHARFTTLDSVLDEKRLAVLAPDRTLVICPSCMPAWARHSVSLSSHTAVYTLNLSVLLDLDKVRENVAGDIVALVTWSRRVLVVDAHMLDELALLRALQLVGTPHELMIAGCTALPSAFRVLLRSAVMQTDDSETDEGTRCVLNSAEIDEYAEVFGNSAPVPAPEPRELRGICLRAAGNDNSVVGSLARLVSRSMSAREESAYALLLVAAPMHRWILVASTMSATRDALVSIRCHAQESNDPWSHCQQLTDALDLVIDNVHRLSEFLFTNSPLIGYQRRCIVVRRLYTYQHCRQSVGYARFRHIHRDDCFELTGTIAVSLDSENLMLEIAAEDADENHTVCCNTWAHNILRVAVHRSALTSQSIVIARDVLPMRFVPVTACVMGSQFRFEDVYNALVTAAYVTGQVVFFNAPRESRQLHDMMRQRYGQPRTCLPELYEEALDERDSE